MIELKKLCPFCGNKGHIMSEGVMDSNDVANTIVKMYTPYCRECGCGDFDWFATPEEAETFWDTRYQNEDEVVISKDWFHKYQAAYILQEVRMGNTGKTICVGCGAENCPDMLDQDHYLGKIIKSKNE